MDQAPPGKRIEISSIKPVDDGWLRMGLTVDGKTAYCRTKPDLEAMTKEEDQIAKKEMHEAHVELGICPPGPYVPW